VPELLPRRAFIGRATELARLKALLDRVTDRQESRTVVIGGEAGIGKSQLIDVSNIMGKLGASNRGEAAAIAHRLGIVAR
jgi:predicted ATPase